MKEYCNNLIFFGAGKIGRRILGDFRRQNMLPSFFMDNSSELWNREIEGIKVLSPDLISDLSEPRFVITCQKTSEIRQQLLSAGIPEDNILNLDDPLDRAEAFCTALRHGCKDASCNEEIESHEIVVFDFQNGDVLGGVETWSYRTMRYLEQRGYNTVPFFGGTESGFPEVCTIVTNFPQENFYKACMEKAKNPSKIRHITNISNDENIYYDRYAKLHDYIDYCIVISSKMTKEMERRGFPGEKILMMQYHVAIAEPLYRTYSKKGEALRIGYAGRVVKHQKKVGRLIELADELRNRDCDFRFEIAGEGDESENIENEIINRCLQDKVFCLGRLNESKMADFWKRQDIKISCSDYEGHSISQVEAMAGGAVPIITDVSGARDDVENGVNGFVIAVGDIKQMADRVMELYLDRDRMALMGQKAHQTIWEREKEKNIIDELFPVIHT